MEWLITTLLKYARIESNVVKYNKDTIPLKETIVNAIGPLRLKAEEKSQKIFEISNELEKMKRLLTLREKRAKNLERILRKKQLK